MVVKQQLQVTNFGASLWRSQAGNPVIKHRVVQLARSDRGHLIFCIYFFKFQLITRTVCDSSF